MTEPPAGAVLAQLHRLSMAQPHEPFRFLNLPLELRLMVYDYFEIETRRYGVATKPTEDVSDWTNDVFSERKVRLHRKSIPRIITLLSICRQITQEASRVLEPKLRKLEQEPLRFYSGYSAACTLIKFHQASQCFDGNVERARALDNPLLKDFCSRVATFLAHTRGVPRTSHGAPHVEFVLYRSGAGAHRFGRSTPYGKEVMTAVEGVFDVGVRTGLTLTFKMFRCLPDVHVEVPITPGRIVYVPSLLLYSILRARLLAKCHRLQSDSLPSVCYRAVATAKQWKEILEDLV